MCKRKLVNGPARDQEQASAVLWQGTVLAWNYRSGSCRHAGTVPTPLSIIRMAADDLAQGTCASTVCYKWGFIFYLQKTRAHVYTCTFV